ncbi:MAG: hypothetical protein ACRDCE_04515, partial [Cetobacterium sp.]|uniref:hypothetical protein n=1 Tax=Cetobacterium sp. TaxID=2071632 RepID=UPI003EE6EE7A
NFCAAFGFAQEQINTLATYWSLPDADFVRNVASTWDKYSALNLRPLISFGSIEFRSSTAEWRKGKLVRLCNRFLGLVEYATNYPGTIEEMINDLAVMDPRQIMRKGFQNTALPEDWQEDILTGVKLAHDLLTFTRLPVAPVANPGPTIISLNRGPFVPMSRDNARWVRDTLTARYGYHFMGTFRTVEAGGRTYTGMPAVAIRAVMQEHNVSASDILDGHGREALERINSEPQPVAVDTIQFSPPPGGIQWGEGVGRQFVQSLAAGQSIQEFLDSQEADTDEEDF